MITIATRLAIVAGASFLIYLYFSKKGRASLFSWIEDVDVKKESIDITPIPAEHSPNASDIVLASLSDGDNAILWNCKPNVAYHYSIKDVETGRLVANSYITPATHTAKIKNIPITKGRVYDIVVGDTKFQVRFDPPNILEQASVFSTSFIEIRTTYMPTGVEVLMDSNRISDEHIGIFGDPNPGVRIDKAADCKELVIMVYNGPNAVYIFSKDMEVS